MEWHIAPHSRVDIHVFSGINFSGERRITNIHAAGGRQGSALNDFAFRSIAISGPIGTTVVLCTSVLDIGWESRPWRAFRVIKGAGFRTKEGKIAIRAPELDWFDASDAHRTDNANRYERHLSVDLLPGLKSMGKCALRSGLHFASSCSRGAADRASSVSGNGSATTDRAVCSRKSVRLTPVL